MLQGLKYRHGLTHLKVEVRKLEHFNGYSDDPDMLHVTLQMSVRTPEPEPDTEVTPAAPADPALDML
jgi:hypothetical protein